LLGNYDEYRLDEYTCIQKQSNDMHVFPPLVESLVTLYKIWKRAHIVWCVYLHEYRFRYDAVYGNTMIVTLQTDNFNMCCCCTSRVSVERVSGVSRKTFIRNC